MKKLSKRILSKNHRVPVSADGMRLRAGSQVFCIWTVDGGVTWHVSRSRVVKTTRRGMVQLEDHPGMWSYAWKKSEMVGDHRIFATEENAMAEILKRNRKLATRGQGAK